MTAFGGKVGFEYKNIIKYLILLLYCFTDLLIYLINGCLD